MFACAQLKNGAAPQRIKKTKKTKTLTPRAVLLCRCPLSFEHFGCFPALAPCVALRGAEALSGARLAALTVCGPKVDVTEPEAAISKSTTHSQLVVVNWPSVYRTSRRQRNEPAGLVVVVLLVVVMLLLVVLAMVVVI